MAKKYHNFILIYNGLIAENNVDEKSNLSLKQFQFLHTIDMELKNIPLFH